MRDAVALKEIEKQEKRFAAAECQRGMSLVKSARECYGEIEKLHAKFVAVEKEYKAGKAKVDQLMSAAGKAEAEAKKLIDKAAKLKAEAAKVRKAVTTGDRLLHKENMARIRFEDKVKRLGTMPIE